MTTAYTSLLGLALPVTGELSGTWGDTVNNSITSLLDTSVAGTTNVSTDTDVTLTTTTGAANTARQAILLFSGARTALRTVTAPAQSKIYTVINATTGGFSVKLVGVGPTTGVTIVAGESAVCAWNGSDFIKISNTGGSGSFTNVTISGTTTLSGLTASTALALNASKEVVSVTNTGTGNNVLSASPTLTGTIGAAALTLSSDLTLSGGTANGVAYLNGSKVVTSGSALTFDGTNFVNTAGFLGTTQSGASSSYFIAKNSVATSGVVFGAHSSGAGYIDVINNNPLFFAVNDTEQMRLTSTGLGIGTSSPAYKLSVNGASSGVVANIGYNGDSGTGLYVGVTHASNLVQLYATGTANKSMAFYTGSTEVMRYDTSGNLGLGVSPSAWASVKAIQYINGAAWGIGTTDSGLSHNAYFSGGWKYISSSAASTLYAMSSGAHAWSVAASGTAGNTITFTQAMTLSANGILLVGTTSEPSTVDGARIYGYGSGNTALELTKAGVVSVRVSAVSTGMAFGVDTSDGTTERARIDSSGNLLVGTTSTFASSKVTFRGSGNTLTCWDSGGASSAALICRIDATNQRLTTYNYNGSDVGTVTTNGSTTSYNTSSDYRLKNITGALTGYKERLMSLQPKQGTWKVNGSEFRGFLAHDFAVPYRASVTGEKDAVDANGNPVMQAMQASSSEVMADLVAMVKDLITENASLKARLDAANL